MRIFESAIGQQREDLNSETFSSSWRERFFTDFAYLLDFFLFISDHSKQYQGNFPRRKPSRTYTSDSKSSFLPCFRLLCVSRDAYRAVPVRLLPVLVGMCQFVLGSTYCLDRP